MALDDRPDYPSTFLVGWEFRGPIDRKAFERSMAFAYERHPLLRALLQPVKLNRDCWVSYTGEMPRVDWGDWDEPITLKAGEFIDLRSEVGFRIWVRHDQQRARITSQFHHAACDGIGALQFWGDVFWHYARDFGVALDPLPELPHEKLCRRLRVACRPQNFLDFDGQPLERFRDTLQTCMKPAAPLSSSRGHDFSRPFTLSFPGIQSAWIDTEGYQHIKAAGLEHGLTPNDYCIVKLLLAMHQWNIEQGQSGDEPLCLLIPMDLREPDCMDISACNIVTESFVHRAGEYLDDEAALRSCVEEEMLRVKNQRHHSEFMGMLTIVGRPDAPMPEALSGRYCVTTGIFRIQVTPLAVSIPRCRVRKGGCVVAIWYWKTPSVFRHFDRIPA